VTDDRGANASAMSTVTVTAPAPPSVTLSVTPLSGKVPLNVTAFAWASTTSGTPSVVINWGDGTPVSTANTANHTYYQPGNFTVTATATDALGYKSTATAVVSVSRGKLKLSHVAAPSSLSRSLTWWQGQSRSRQLDQSVK